MSEKKVRVCEVVQQVKRLDMDKFFKVLDAKKQIEKYAFIIHDKDRDDKGLLKEPHVHCVIRLKSPNGFKTIGNWFGIPANCIGKINGRLSDALNYLTHRNAKDKFQYNDDEVIANFDWVSERKEVAGNSKAREEEIITKIANGEIRGFNMAEHITAIEFAKYKIAIDRAKQYRGDMLKAKSTKGEKQMEVIFIEGSSGSGKTTYAKEIAEKQGYSVCISSSANDPLQDYDGQDCFILDDLRPDTFKPDDLLKLLDNHTSSTVKSRYYNKWLECKMIIVTSVKSVRDFTCYFGQEEPAEQLMRRCKMRIRMNDEQIEVFAYNEIEKKYDPVAEFKNPIAEKYKKRGLTVEDKKKMLTRLPGAEMAEAAMGMVTDESKKKKLKDKITAFDIDPERAKRFFENGGQLEIGFEE